jgi:hypothetical protein
LPTRTPDRVASVVEEIAPVTASAPEFTAASVDVPDADSVVNAPVEAVVAPTVPLIFIEAVPVKFVTTPLLGVPSAGVTRLGLVFKTFAPEPVEDVTPVPPLTTGRVPLMCVAAPIFPQLGAAPTPPEISALPDATSDSLLRVVEPDA